MALYDPEHHHRRSIRLPGWNYSQSGVYFVTICTQGRLCLFGNVVNGEMELTDAGWVIDRIWRTLPDYVPGTEIGASQVMPNHLHGIVIRRPAEDDMTATPGAASGRPHGTAPGSLGRVVQVFKSQATYEYAFGVKHYGWQRFLGKLFQRNYYEHIVRSEEEWERVHWYIVNNPARWAFDRENSDRGPGVEPDPWPFDDDVVVVGDEA